MVIRLLEYLVRELVTYPNQVEVLLVSTPEKDMLEIKVNDEDKGKIIGRDGHTIKSLRILAETMTPTHKKIAIDISRL